MFQKLMSVLGSSLNFFGKEMSILVPKMKELLVPVISKTLKIWQFSWKNQPPKKKTNSSLTFFSFFGGESQLYMPNLLFDLWEPMGKFNSFENRWVSGSIYILKLMANGYQSLILRTVQHELIPAQCFAPWLLCSTALK
jgi:hypothetical protein